MESGNNVCLTFSQSYLSSYEYFAASSISGSMTSVALGFRKETVEFYGSRFVYCNQTVCEEVVCEVGWHRYRFIIS